MQMRRGSVMHATDRPTYRRWAVPPLHHRRPSRAALPPGPPSASPLACLPPSLYPYPVASGTPPVARRGPIYTPRPSTAERSRAGTFLPRFHIPRSHSHGRTGAPTLAHLVARSPGELRRSARPPPPTRLPWRKPRVSIPTPRSLIHPPADRHRPAAIHSAADRSRPCLCFFPS